MDECNKECSKEYIYLLVTSIFTSVLWVISEIIGSSSCKSNGIFEFIINGFCVKVEYEILDDDEISITDDGAFLITKKSLPHYMGI